MQRWGTTSAGKPRWRCAACEVAGTRRREDSRAGARLSLFVRWVSGEATAANVSASRGVSRQTTWRWFSSFWSAPPGASGRVVSRVLVLDATGVVRLLTVALLAGDPATSRPVGWGFAPRECLGALPPFLLALRERGADPECVVCDGQKGLLKAVRAAFPSAAIQRCVIHVHRQAMSWLTRNPQTEAGREIRRLVSALLPVRDAGGRDEWLGRLRSWEERHADFLKERTFGDGGRWWYTHRKLRAVRSLVRNAAPNLFRYIDDPGVPRTSNHVEGGLNARIKELLRSHRGITKRQRMALASWYLHIRAAKKPTRNVT